MFIRPIKVKKNGTNHKYWALVESYRTERGPRQRTVAYLGKLPDKVRRGVKDVAEEKLPSGQTALFDEPEPEWIEVNTSGVRLERCRGFGSPWLGLKLAQKIGLDDFLRQAIPNGREDIPWPEMVLALVLCRLCDPSSELHIAEHFYEHSGMADLLGIPAQKVNDDRLYRALDVLLPHKEELEKFLADKLGRLFGLEYDLLLYDITSTYFEGRKSGGELAQRGYSRDKRPDCKQVCIGLVVSRCGMPLGYEIFEGNRSDSTTVEEVVETMEKRYGSANRIWVMDRGMVSEENIEFLRSGDRRYIIGTPKSKLKSFEKELLSSGWNEVRDGVEVKLQEEEDGEETYILCRSRQRREKEKAIHGRFEQKIEQKLRKMEAYCEKRNYRMEVIAERIGRLKEKYSRAAGLFEINLKEKREGGVKLDWKKKETRKNWAELSEGCYLLRSNIKDWKAQDLWDAYVQLTEAEAAFRIQKNDLKIRPIWHQREDRTRAHILVCFLGYVLWKTLGRLCHESGLGDEPRRVFSELGKIKVVDVILPTRRGVEIRKRCVTRPNEYQQILLDHLGMKLPEGITPKKM
jgi:transposase